MKQVRIFILLLVLLAVVTGNYLTRARTTDWNESLFVTLYPINGDGRAATQAYIDRLEPRLFARVEKFVASEAARYGVGLTDPVRVELGPQIASLPPDRPDSFNPLTAMWWSLRLRLWASSATDIDPRPEPDIRLFLIYYDPEVTSTVPHSLGLEKGMLGVVSLFASRDQAGPNNFVLTHEMLHTLGATDKYAGPDNLPVFPHGYADPERQPLYPQKKAEIMGGRIPVSESRADIPASLRDARVGNLTAAEIRWN